MYGLLAIRFCLVLNRGSGQLDYKFVPDLHEHRCMSALVCVNREVPAQGSLAASGCRMTSPGFIRQCRHNLRTPGHALRSMFDASRTDLKRSGSSEVQDAEASMPLRSNEYVSTRHIMSVFKLVR